MQSQMKSETEKENFRCHKVCPMYYGEKTV